MNRLLTHYCVDVQHPEVSGAEHLEMLKIRDQLSDVEATLSEAERQQLAEADRLLVMQAEVVSRGLLKFLNLSQHRQTTHIPPERWWYLDVVRHVPYLGQVKKAITSIKKDVFLTGDVLRILKGQYYSDTKTPAGASRNAQSWEVPEKKRPGFGHH